MLDTSDFSTATDYPQGNGYHQLEGDWALFYKVARCFVHKVKFEDKEDFLHDLMLEMAKVKAKYEVKGKPLTEAGLMRVASYEVTEYWHTLIRHRPTMLSLNGKTDNGNGDGEAGEVIDFLADDSTVDLDLKLDARRFLLGCPRRLVQIAYKRYSGQQLDRIERRYLERHGKNRNYILDNRSFPRFHCWDNPKPVGKSWAFGWLTGIDNDLICIFPYINSRVMEHWALSPVHQFRLVAFLAFIAKRFLFLVDNNLQGVDG